MCGTASFGPTAALVETLKPDKIGRRVPALDTSRVLQPGSQIPVLVHHHGDRVLTGMKWGFEDGRIYNARSETITQKPYWQDWYQYFRGVVPLHQFKEGRGWFSATNAFALSAAVWRPIKFASPSGTWFEMEVSIITQQANPVVAQYHHRQPVIISQRQIADLWLQTKVGIDDVVSFQPPAPQDFVVAA